MSKYVCPICGYVYDEAMGDTKGGIAPGTRWEDVPESWVCPLCRAPKSDFGPQQAKQEAAPVETGHVDELRQLTGGPLRNVEFLLFRRSGRRVRHLDPSLGPDRLHFDQRLVRDAEGKENEQREARDERERMKDRGPAMVAASASLRIRGDLGVGAVLPGIAACMSMCVCSFFAAGVLFAHESFLSTK